MTLTDDECAAAIRKVNGWRAVANIYEPEITLYRAGYAAGLAAIPREPTTAMLRVNVQHGVCGSYLSGCALGDTWRAMYDAARKP